MSDESPAPATKPAANTDVAMIVGCVIAVAALAASVVLVLADKPTASILSIAGPIIGSLFVGSYMSSLTGQQNKMLTTTVQKVEKVERQTNGVMDERIRRQTLAALADAGLIPPPDAPVVTYAPRHATPAPAPAATPPAPEPPG